MMIFFLVWLLFPIGNESGLAMIRAEEVQNSVRTVESDINMAPNWMWNHLCNTEFDLVFSRILEALTNISDMAFSQNNLPKIGL